MICQVCYYETNPNAKYIVYRSSHPNFPAHLQGRWEHKPKIPFKEMIAGNLIGKHKGSYEINSSGDIAEIWEFTG